MKLNRSSIAVILTTIISISGGMAADASTFPTKKYTNCKALNKKYPGGVARSANVTNSGGATHYAPTISAKIYKENKSKDRDHDGIACER